MIGSLAHVTAPPVCPGIVTTHVHTLPLFLWVPVISIDLEMVDSSDKIMLSSRNAPDDDVVLPTPPI